MSLRELRPRFAPYLRPARAALGRSATVRRKSRYFRDGIEGICADLRTAIDCVPILRQFGASVGAGATVAGPLVIMNADRDFSNLVIGARAYVGPDVLMDLADRVTIEDEATLSMRCNLITHFDVGESPLLDEHPRKQGPVTIASGAYLGVGVTVLHGVTVGARALIGANCLLRKDVPPGATLVAGDPLTLREGE